MKRTIEVELKYNITKKIPKGLFRFIERIRIIDKYYDTKDGKFFKQGIFIRLRNNKKVDFKFNLEDTTKENSENDHTHCDEYSFQIPFKQDDFEKFSKVCNLTGLKVPDEFNRNKFLEVNNLTELVVVSKQRSNLKQRGFDVSVDKVKDLGMFIEVEKSVELDKNEIDSMKRLDKIKRDIDLYVEELNIGAVKNETGYCELVLRKVNYDLYKSGRYVLEKDKE